MATTIALLADKMKLEDEAGKRVVSARGRERWNPAVERVNDLYTSKQMYVACATELVPVGGIPVFKAIWCVNQ